MCSPACRWGWLCWRLASSSAWLPEHEIRRQVLQASDYFVVLHRGDLLAQVGYRLVEFGLADEVKRIPVLRRDLVGEKVEILTPLFGSQRRK